MAYGIIQVIPNQTHVQVLLQGGGATYPSARVLNPNDGILYVAENRDCTGTGQGAWDWKIPSQSFAILPGGSPGMQTIGLYYLDQSGANSSGEVTVYPTLTPATDPAFVAIGRANLVYQNVLDITQGAQPANPGIGQSRLWVDSSSVLHVLAPNGQDHVVLDSTNYASYVNGTALGADLYGTVSAGHVAVQNGSAIYGKDSGGINRFAYQPTGDNYNAYFCGTAGMTFVNSANSVRIGTMDNSGTLTMSGDVHGRYLYTSDGSNGVVYSAGSLYLRPASGGTVVIDANTGATGNLSVASVMTAGAYLVSPTWYIGGAAGTRYIQDVNPSIRYAAASGGVHSMESSAGGYASLNCGAIGVNGNINTTGVLVLPDTSYGIQWVNSNCAIYGSQANALMQFTSGGNPTTFRWYAPSQGIYCDFGVGTLTNAAWAFNFHNSAWIAVGQGFVVGGNNLNGQSFYCAGGSGGPTGWQIVSTRRYKRDITPIDSALKIVLSDVHGYHFVSEPPDHFKLRTTVDTDEILEPASYAQYGFIGEEWENVAPDVLDMDEGQVRMMDYGQVTAILFEAFREYVAQTEVRLRKLEGSHV